MEKEDVLRKVRALMERADHPNTPEAEAEACQIKADQLMLVYAIESFDLKTGEATKPDPEMRAFVYGSTGDGLADNEIVSVFYRMASHCGVKVGFFGWKNSKIVGYPSDLDYLDLLFTSVRLDLSSKVALRADPNLSLEDNVAAFKSAGWKWADIYDALMAKDLVPYYANGRSYVPKVDGGITFRAYKRWLKAHPGEEHIGESPQRYKRGFVKGYCETVSLRLMRMSRAREETVNEKGYGIVLRNRSSELDEFFWEQFPDMRPHDPNCQCSKCYSTKKNRVVRYREQGFSTNAYRKGSKAGDSVNLNLDREGLTKQQEISGS